ncbi:hypothetical protein [Bradyrhizobium elkanii]|uniref:hypothetical protein n=1 Tax=Bradyrhizobium elkanii TaxID=29448 RepID=UPI0005C237D8|nr:hypothetical protein QU41_00020 [Bradyrhizobium elkanii]
MSIPNIIPLGRIILVPVIVWAIVSSQMEIAYAISIWLDTMAQTITGTRMMRPRGMMFGMLNFGSLPG